MATIADLVEGKHLVQFELPEWDKRSPIRDLYINPAIIGWTHDTPAVDDGSIIMGGRTPLDHLEQFFADLRCAEYPSTTEFRRMQPTNKGIWKCHPPTLRVFGWCYAPYSFAGVSAELESVIKSTPGLYQRHLKGVLAFVKLHGAEGTILRGDQRVVFPKTR